MIVIASIWEFGWNTPIKEFDLWYYPMMDFGVDEIAMTPISGINKKVKEFPDIDSLINHYVRYHNLDVVLCDENGVIDVKEFKHPENVLYLFGKTTRSLLSHYNYPSIRVVTPNNKGMLWGHQAASIIMYDRFLKWQ